MDRLAKSGLKAAVLLSAARRQEEKLIVTESDLVKAFSYVEQWRVHTLEVINNMGRSTAENQINAVMGSIQRKPGIRKSEIMRNYHLSAREMGQILDTLDQRAMITQQRDGRGAKLFPVGG